MRDIELEFQERTVCVIVVVAIFPRPVAFGHPEFGNFLGDFPSDSLSNLCQGYWLKSVLAIVSRAYSRHT